MQEQIHIHTYMKTGITFSILCIALALFSACEKVINIDLKNAAPKVIIEGTITDDPFTLSHTVLVSKSNSFSSNGKNSPVSAALVIVEDVTSNVIDTLEEINPGRYKTQKIMGIEGHTYKLRAIVGGIAYTAISTMPKAVSLDSLYIQTLPFFGEEFKQVIPVFKDPIGQENYYRFSLRVNDSVQNDFEAWDDLITNGKVNSRPLGINAQELLDGDDTVYVRMNSTEKAIYDFFYTLENASGNGQTPGNPLSNISNGAIGYFGAITVRERYVIVP